MCTYVQSYRQAWLTTAPYGHNCGAQAQAQAPSRVKGCACMTSIWIGPSFNASRLNHLCQGSVIAIASHKSPPGPRQRNNFIVFSAQHSFAEIKEGELKNNNLPKFGCCLPTCIVYFCFFGGFVFCFSVFLLFCLAKKPNKVIFLQFLSFFVPPKSLCLKCFLSLFYFVIPFENIFICFLPINLTNPLLENIYLFVFVCFFFGGGGGGSFVNVSLFLKQNLLIFSKPICINFWLFLLLFGWCMFLHFCFYVGFVFGMFSYVFIAFLFSFCFRTMKKHGFPCYFVFFWVMLVRRLFIRCVLWFAPKTKNP